MRRLIAYITMAVSMLIAIGVAATPVLTKLNCGREFASGREIVFKIDSDDGLEEGAVDEVADEMRSRLDNFNVEDYSVKVQGEDTIVCSFDVDKNEFDYVAKYLTFSGRKFGISGDEEKTIKNEHTLFEIDDAKIEYKSDAKVPVIVIPVTDQGKEDIEALVKELNPEDSTTPASAPRKADEHNHEEGEQHPYIYLWANYEEGDSIESAANDPLVRDKILMSFDSQNIWYEDSKEEKTEISFICATASEEDQTQLDLSGLKNDNIRANYLLNMLQATEYKCNVTCPTRNITKDSVDYYTNSTVVDASIEPLLSKSGSNINIAFSKTFISSLIAIAIVSLLLIVYYRISSIAMIATTLGTMFIALIALSGMDVLFNIPAIIGLIILGSAVLFGQIVYLNRFKEEVYKGRTVKKANQEASKKSNLVTLDSAVIMAFSGLMMYFVGGTALKPMGVVLFFGAIFILVMNLLVFKFMMHLVTNTTSIQNKYNLFNIIGDKVPNLMSTEVKETYESPYEKVDFTKKKNVIGIIFGALAFASIVVMTVFGAIDKSPLNVKKATADTTVIYTTIKVDNPIIDDETTFKKYALNEDSLVINDDEKVTIDSINMKKVSVYEYIDESNSDTKETYFFTCEINKVYSDKEREDIQVAIENSLSNNLSDLAAYEIDIDVLNSTELIYTPNQGKVILATSLSIIGAALYIAFRFRPSRAISLLVSTVGTTAIAYGLFVATRTGTTAVTSLAMPLVAINMMLASLFLFSTEKAMRKENHIDLTKEQKRDIMIKAIGKSTTPMFAFMLVTIYIAINFFGFSVDQTSLLFAATLLGQVVGAVVILTVVGPLSDAIEVAFKKIHLPKIKAFEHKDKVKTVRNRNSSEPEETVFIGIND